MFFEKLSLDLFINQSKNITDMKKLIFITAGLLLAFTSFAKEQNTDTINNFTLNDGSVTWTYIYENQDSVAARIWFTENFEITQNVDRKIIGKTHKSVLPINEAGYSNMSVIMILTKSWLNAKHPWINFTRSA